MQLSLSANPPAPIDQSRPGQEPLASKTSGRFSVAPWPAVTSFFTSMSPSYTPKSLASSLSHGQPPSGPGKQSSLPSAVQGVGLASKVISCWLPQVGLAGEIISSACSSFSLAHQLGPASRKSDGSASSSGEKQTPPGHGQVLSNAFSGAGAAALGLIAMDSLAGAAAEAFPGPTPPLPLPPDTHMAPPLGQVALPSNFSHMALNGSSMAPVTQMSMASPASIFPGTLPTSAAPAASAALSLAGGLSPLTLIGLSVGISALMSGVGALYGCYADGKKEQ